MTNTELLEFKIRESGYKLNFIASVLNITDQTLRKKIRNENLFNSNEINELRKLLNLTLRDVDRIFFAKKVDGTSTN